MQNLSEQLALKTMELDEENIISPYSRSDEKNFNNFKPPVKEAAVLVSFLHRQDQSRLILTRRTLSLSNHKGQIAFPGGKIDKEDLSPSHAAIREANEEIGINQEQIKVLGKLPLYQTVTGYNITPIVGELSPPFIFKKAEDEVDEIFELPVEFMMDVKNFKRESVIYEGERREFWALPFNDYYIWGATAAILRELAGRFEKL
ncbi:MAG: CoA pyrophosphatase [Rhodomicrobiaceae bacterium]